MENKNQHASNRSFGFLLTGVCVVLSAYAAYHKADLPRAYCWLIVGLVVCMVAITAPAALTPFNKAWMKVGDVLSKIVSPVVLAVIFFALITPIALLSRLLGRDELRLKKTNFSTCWISRTPPGPAGNTFKNQF